MTDFILNFVYWKKKKNIYIYIYSKLFVCNFFRVDFISRI